RIEGVPQRTVTPPPEELKRIQQDNALTRQARRQDLARRDFLQTFQWPITGRITGVYGSQRIYHGEPRQPHYGVDVAARVCCLVRAAVDGVVTLVHDDMLYYGGTLIVDHGHGVSSTFLHLSKIVVEKGSQVKQGYGIAE